MKIRPTPVPYGLDVERNRKVLSLYAVSTICEGSTSADRKLFLFRLISSRPTFPMDMTEAERKIMQEHVGYWTNLRDKGIAVAFGPVLDPKGVWGLAVVEAASEADARALIPGDPAFKGGIGSYEVLPMGLEIVRKRED